MLSDSNYKRYLAIIHNSRDQHDILSDNEVQFLSDLEAKFDKYRRNTFVSDKQDDWLDKIEARLQKELGSAYEE